MQVLSRNIPTVKTETADVCALLHAHINGNGRARDGGNDRRHRPRRQIHHGYRRAALKADTAVTLVSATGMSNADAIARCDTSTNDFYAMKALRESGNTALYNAVLRGDAPIRESAKLVENAAVAIVAFKKCSVLERELVRCATGATNDPVTMLLNLPPDQLRAVSKTLGTDWVWNNMIEPAMPTSETPSEVVSESAIALNVA